MGGMSDSRKLSFFGGGGDLNLEHPFCLLGHICCFSSGIGLQLHMGVSIKMTESHISLEESHI